MDARQIPPMRGPPRRRRPTLWDVREPPYGVPMPPPPVSSATTTPSVPTSAPAPVAQRAPEPRPFVGVSMRPGAVVGPPQPGRSGPLAGIDIAGLRALLAPKAHGGSASGQGGAFGHAAGNGMDVPLGSPLHATRHARKLYVGNLPVNTTDVEVGDFFNRALVHAKGVETAGNPVISVYLNLEKRFAFIELRSLSEAAAALAMDGVLFKSMSLRMRRPNDYNEAACPPVKPPRGFDASLLGVVSTQVGDGPNKVFIGNIPYDLNEDEVKALLQAHGRLAAFNLIKDANTGLSKGYAFFEYADPGIVDIACRELNSTTIQDKMLTVRRATQNRQGGSDGAVGREMPRGTGSLIPAASLLRKSTRIVELRNAVTTEELEDDEIYEDVVGETEDEARRLGALQKLVIPRPGKGIDGADKGVGRIFLVFEKSEDAERAFAAMNGRKFAEREVEAAYVEEEAFEKGDV